VRRSIVALAAILTTACGGGLLPAAQQPPTPPPPERASVRIGVVALNAFIQLPLAFALQLGYFASQGIVVETVDESSGLQALTDLGAGKVDLISVPYEFTIRAQMAGNSIAAIALYQLRPGFVLSIGKLHFNDVHSMKDFIGRPICITARGTSTEAYVRWLAIRDGVDPSAIPFHICGTSTAEYSTRLASGDVWGAVQVDPPYTKLEQGGFAKALYDTRSLQGSKQVYGGSGLYPTQALIAPRQFLIRYPNTSLALVRVIAAALGYIHSHPAADTAAHMPAEYKQGDPDLYASSLKQDLGMFSIDGIMPADGPTEVLKVLQAVSPDAGDAQIDLAQTFDNTFAIKAQSSELRRS